MNEHPQIPSNRELGDEKDPSRRALLAAMQRMLLGHPKHVQVGALSISDLAKEAQVGRHELYQRSPDLRDRFVYLRDRAHSPSAAEVKLERELLELRTEIIGLRQLQARTHERAENWKGLCETLQRGINVLQEELRQEQLTSRRLARRSQERHPPDSTGLVLPIRGRPAPK